MDVYGEILQAKHLRDAYVEMRCYAAVKKIKAVIMDDSLADPECFQKVEEIICALEDIGLACGSRHDF